MRTKGVFLLGLIACWAVVCNCEDGSTEDFGLEDTLSKELLKDYLFQDDDENVPCKEPTDCEYNQKCKIVEGNPSANSCVCADGLAGEDCKTLEWCQTGKFINCKDENGTCAYDNGTRAVTCQCVSGKGLHPTENRCRDTCTADTDCANGANCGNDFCLCSLGLFGDKCQTVFDCTAEGKYRDCKDPEAACSYDVNTKTAICKCAKNQAYHDTEHICKECDCGTEGICSFKDGQKKCACNPGFVEKDKTCKECEDNKECGVNKKCKKEKEVANTCVCADGLSGDNCLTVEWCETGKFIKCKGVNGTCAYNDAHKTVLCTCNEAGKELHPNENRCRDTCTIEAKDCQHGGECKENAGHWFCSCKLGLIGDKCETIFDCTSVGKYKDCISSGGDCSYDVKAQKAVCNCQGNKKLNVTENKCRECDCGSQGTCSFKDGKKTCDCKQGFGDKGGTCTATCTKHEECKDNQKCGEVGDWKTCVCADGLSGNECDKKDWCETDGQFKDCKGDYGKCDYVKEKRAVDCICPAEKGLHPEEKKCRATCNEGECEHGSVCQSFGGVNLCNCTKGLSGDKCSIVDDCADNGKFKDCKDKQGECAFDEEKKAAVCECEEGKKLDSVLNYCLDCVCGENAECSISNKATTCSCIKGFVRNGENCEECDCGDKGTCSFENGKKKCNCVKNYLELDGKCTVCDCGDNGKCDFKDGKPNCTCNLTYIVKEKDGKCYKCDCGTGGICSFNDQDKPVCACKEGYKEYKGKCKECNCGPHGDCSFDENGVQKCDCPEGFTLKKEGTKTTCVEICNDDCDHETKCEGVEGKKYCRCIPASELGGDKCEIVKECQDNGKYRKCADTGGDCKFDTTQKKATCTCTEPHKLDLVLNFCREKCSPDKNCTNGAECKNELCQCKPGTAGDYCDEVLACKTLKCEEKEAECNYDFTKSPNTFCVCKDEKYTFVKDKCVEKCSTDKDCQNGATCDTQTKLCDCKTGTSGDKCEKVDCGDQKCEEIDAKCVFDIDKSQPTCECNDKSYYYANKKCLAIWCKEGCNLKVSTCDYNNGVGVCNCTDKGKYYDYAAEDCKSIGKCLGVECKENEVCKNGKCECQKNYKKNGDKCEEMDLCDKDNNKCFPGAKCEKGSKLGFVKCPCESDSKFYISNKCDDGSCFLPGKRAECKLPCPSGMTRTNGDCKHKEEKTVCDKECGFLGWCYKFSEKLQKCVCDPKYAELDTKSEKCVLKASAVCPTKERDGADKCKCTGKYKLADNKITCELKSCSDEDVQNECKGKRAECVENWKGNNIGYQCVCPDGYVDDKDKGCIDACSQDNMKDKCSGNGQVCYVGSKLKDGDCRCPPTFSFDQTKQSCDLSGANTYMIHKLPVLSKKYETPEKDINKALLNIDVSNSMNQAYKNLDFVHVFNFKVENDVLLCDIWIQFKPQLPVGFNATLEVQRWRSYKREVNNQHFLPPALPLSGSKVDEATEEQLTLCTTSVRQTVCGKGSYCDDKKGCSCDTGYRVIDSTIKTYGTARILRCEDIDECSESTHNCSAHSECINTLGGFFCKCDAGFRKEKGAADAMDREACVGLCDLKPCGMGSCQLNKVSAVDCTCQAGYSGSYCNRKDVYLAKASSATKVVGAVLGTLLGIVIILIIVYVVRQRKNAYSEDFTPAPRIDNAEMIERRTMQQRGVTNRGYE